MRNALKSGIPYRRNALAALFLLFFLVTLFLYWPARDAGFVMDFIGWQHRFENGSASDIWNSFGYPGLYQVFHGIFYGLYALVGIHGTVWLIVFAAAHAGNTIMLYSLSRRLLNHIQAEKTTFIPLAVAIIFLLSPYHAEVIIWKVCMHYLLSLFFLLAGLLLLWDYVEKGKVRSLIFFLLVFCASLFTLEFALVFPLIFVAFYLLLISSSSAIKAHSRHYAILLFPFFLVLAYLLLNRAVLGSIVGHYGAGTHLQLDPFSMNASIWQYFVKILCFLRFASHDLKSAVFDGMLKPIMQFGLLFITLSTIVILPMIWKRINNAWKLVGFSAAGFALCLLPVSNLYFNYLQYGENDRYGYLAMTFFAIGFVQLCMMLPRFLRNVPILLFAGLSMYYTHFMVQLWAQSNDVYEALVEDFDAYDAETVYLLSVPGNYQGIFMFRIIKGVTGFQEALQYHRGRPFEGEMFDVLQYNMVTPHDGTRVERLGERKFKVSFRQWGNWWWRKGIGASSYENDHYKVTLESLQYTVEFKKDLEHKAILYQDGKQWLRVDL